jgi:hypothetical protein
MANGRLEVEFEVLPDGKVCLVSADKPTRRSVLVGKKKGGATTSLSSDKIMELTRG